MPRQTSHTRPTAPFGRPFAWSALAAAALLAGCSTMNMGSLVGAANYQVTLTRTTHGVAHIQAADVGSMSFGAAYAHAQDNVCQTAQQLVTVRGERSRFFGERGTGGLSVRTYPNPVIDVVVGLHFGHHITDEQLAQRWAREASPQANQMVAGYVAGYNQYLSDHAGKLPAECAGQPWVRPMTLADFRRSNELAMVQGGIAALADAVHAARPPTAPAAAAPLPTLDEALAALREDRIIDARVASNAWAFGREVTANGRGVLLGNPHYPWVGINRFWQMHITVPGVVDVMGGSIGLSPVVQIGFNRDVAWSHTVSTGVRFTLHELSLGSQPTRYLLDGQEVALAPQVIRYQALQEGGAVASREHTVWRSHFGPVVVLPRAGLGWTAQRAYALQDANIGNVRSLDAWWGFNRAATVGDIRQASAKLGIPWVNTIAADRAGTALYADASVVPDVTADILARCTPSPQAAGLIRAARLFVLRGDARNCNWQQDTRSAVPGLIGADRLPVLERLDWVHNSNDSFVYTQPAHRFVGISPLVGDGRIDRPRTRSGLIEIPDLISRGKVTPEGVQRQLFENRNLAARVVLPDLLAACAMAPADSPQVGAEARAACALLRGWDRTSNAEARGAALFREFWREARNVPNVWRVPFDANLPATTPAGLRMDDAQVAPRVWAALTNAVRKFNTAGIAIDAPLGQVQRPAFTGEPAGLHGGDEFEGVLNKLSDLGPINTNTLTPRGFVIDTGTSYVQTVGFDERGPVAHAYLVYGQSTHAASPYRTDQLAPYAAKRWPRLPFHVDEVAAQRIGEPVTVRNR